MGLTVSLCCAPCVSPGTAQNPPGLALAKRRHEKEGPPKMQWAAMGLMMYIRAMRSRYQNGNSLPSTARLCMVGRPALQGLLWAGQDGTVPQPGKRQAPPVVKDGYKRGRLWYGVPSSTCNNPHLLSKSEKKRIATVLKNQPSFAAKKPLQQKNVLFSFLLVLPGPSPTEAEPPSFSLLCSSPLSSFTFRRLPSTTRTARVQRRSKIKGGDVERANKAGKPREHLIV